MIKTGKCKICGKEYTSNVPNKLTCSDKCRRENGRRLAKKWYAENRDAVAEYARKERIYAYKSIAVCKICGESVDNKPLLNCRSRAQYHDKCVYADCKKTLEAGFRLTAAQIQRLARRGYTITDFKEEYMNETERDS